MSARSLVRCDADDCPDYVVGWAGEPWRVRSRAEEHHGWSCDDDGDYCPRHNPTAEDDVEAHVRELSAAKEVAA